MTKVGTELSIDERRLLGWLVDNARADGTVYVPSSLFPTQYGMDVAKARWMTTLVDGGYVVDPDEAAERVTAKGFAVFSR